MVKPKQSKRVQNRTRCHCGRCDENRKRASSKALESAIDKVKDIEEDECCYSSELCPLCDTWIAEELEKDAAVVNRRSSLSYKKE